MSSRAPKNPPMNFEQAIARLEAIVASLDAPQTGLEETITLVAEGQQLIRNCRKLLADAELKIRLIDEQPTAQAEDLGQTEESAQAEPQSAEEPSARKPLASSPLRRRSEEHNSDDDDHGFRLF